MTTLPRFGLHFRGLGAALPDRVVTNDDLQAGMDTSDEWIRERTGISARRLGSTTSELAVAAGAAALRQAGIDRAQMLIAALSSDADNLFVCLSARSMSRDLFIVSRTSDQKNEPKFFQAGANRVVNPHEIGGSRMGALAIQPSVAEFMDEILHDDSHDVSIHEIRVPAESPMIGHALRDLNFRDGQRPLIIAIRINNGRYHANPKPDTVIEADEVIIALGSALELRALKDLVAHGA